MLTIPNLPTQDGYVDALTLGPAPSARMIKYVVANRAAFMRVWPQSKSGTIPSQTDELLVTPETNVITDAMGVQFRSALPGVPAQVVAQLLEPGDPTFGSGTPFSATISSSGGISPGVSSVQVQVDGALVATEPALDFITGLGVRLTGADDPANQRALLTIAAAAIADILLGAPAAFLDFQLIPATYRHLLILAALRDDAAAGLSTPFVRLNNDAGLNYDRLFFNNSGAAFFNAYTPNTNAGFFGIDNSANSQAGGFSNLLARIADYANANTQKIVDVDGSAHDTVGASRFIQRTSAFWHAATQAVNRVTLLPSGANFVQNSRATLYGEA